VTASPTPNRIAAGLALAAALAMPGLAAAQPATRVSVGDGGVQSNGPNYFGNISTNGRYVVFSSDATNLVPGDVNGKTDVFRYDRTTGETVCVSVTSDGAHANGRSFASGVSKDGRLVLFWSHATDLVGDDSNGFEDVFLRDMTTRTTTRLSLGWGGVQTNGGSRFPTMSDDGRYVAFQSYGTNLVIADFNDRDDIYVLDRRTGRTVRVGQPRTGESNEDSGIPQISANGRWVAFESQATNLVGGDTNGVMDAFVVEWARGTVMRASVSDTGVQGNGQSRSPMVSDTGRVLFTSAADNLVSGDTNATSDSFVRDVRRGETRRVNVSSAGVQGNYGSARGTIDPKGRYVAFGSWASNLVPNDTNASADVFLRDLTRGTTVRITAAHDGGEANGNTHAIGFAGRTLLMTSVATNLVPGDTNGTEDLFAQPWR
jgi:Tol biopolymer transport system component